MSSAEDTGTSASSGASAAELDTHGPIPEAGYTELLGVPRAIVEELADLHDQAHQRDLTLPQWRAAHGEVLARASATVDPTQRRKLSSDVISEAISIEDTPPGHGQKHTDGADDADDKRRSRSDHLWSLHQHLVVLGGPPTDEEVTKELPARDRERRASLAEFAPENRARAAARLEEQEALHRAWLRDIDGTPRDPFTGMPHDVIEAHRVSEEPVLGAVPVALAAARATAWLAATDEDRAEAETFRTELYGPRTLTDWRLHEATHSLRRAVLVELLTFARANGSDVPAAAALSELWRGGQFQELMAAFLDDGTSPL